MKIDRYRVRGSRIYFVIVLCLSLNGCRQDSSKNPGSETIRIGEVTTLTGIEASFGTSSHRGVQLALQQINATGGIQGRILEVITLDDRGSPEETTLAATKLLGTDKVAALTGALPSSRGIAMGSIAQKFGIPMVSSASTHPDVTRFGNFVFRVCFIDSFQGHVMAKFALEHLKLKRVALLKDVKSDYSTGMSEYFSKIFKQGGGEILIEQSYSSGDVDFKSQLTAIRAKSPQAIFVPGYYTDIALAARQARELGIFVPLLGGDGLDSPQFLTIGGSAVNHTYYSTHYSSEDHSPRVQGFITQFKEAFGMMPDGLATLGYDGILVLADAMKRSQSMAPVDLRQALMETRNFVGVTGNIRFDENRNPIKSAVVLKVDQGKIQYVTTIQPE